MPFDSIVGQFLVKSGANSFFAHRVIFHDFFFESVDFLFLN